MTQRQRWTRILSGVVGFGAVMDTFGAVVASRSIEDSFHASPWAMRWILGAYLLPLALLLPLGTRLGDRFGHRRTLVTGLAAFSAAAAGCAWSPNVGMLIAARVVAGAGAAAAFSGALGSAEAADEADADPSAEDAAAGLGTNAQAGTQTGTRTGTATRTRAGHAGPRITDFDLTDVDSTGLDGTGFDDTDLDFTPSGITGITGIAGMAAPAARSAAQSGPSGRRLGVTGGVVLGPVLAGLAAQGPGWRWYYGVQAVLGLLLAGGARLWLPERRGRRHALDLEGCAVAAVAVVGVIWALNRSVEIGWGTVEVIGALTLACVAFGFLAVWHLPVGALHRRRFLAANLTELLFAASIFGPAYPAARDLQWVRGIGPLTVGVGLTAWAAVAAGPLALRYATGRSMLSRRWRPAGLLLHCVGLAVLAMTIRGGAHPGVELAAVALSAVGVGVALAADQSLAGLPVPPVVGVLSLVGAVAGIAVLAVTVPGFGAGTAGSYHRELAATLRAATVLAVAATAASLAVPAASGPAPGVGMGIFGRMWCRLAVLPGRGMSACTDGSRAGGHPPGNCFSMMLTAL